MVELTASVLDIATSICWESDEGCELIFRALEAYKVEKGLTYTFESLFNILNKS
jgi:hypothetical protein